MSPLPAIDFSRWGVSRIERIQNDAFTLLAFCAVKQALDNAALETTQTSKRHNTFRILSLSPERGGVYFGTGIGGATTFLANHSHHILYRQIEMIARVANDSGDSHLAHHVLRMTEHLPHPERFNPFAVSMLMPNAAGAALGIKYGLTGPNVTLSTACAASTMAIGHGFRAIQAGDVDLVIAGGSEYLRDEYGGVFRGFDIAGTLVHGYSDPEKANRPFDKARTGFLFSEGGAAALVLEERERALRRNAPIVAEVCGYGETFDAHSMMSMEPKGIEIERMFIRAADSAGISLRDVDYVNTHGTATKVNDALEAMLIEKLFRGDVRVNATKSLTGHLIGASGGVEAAVTALSLKNQVTHGCKNLENPVAELNFVLEAHPLDLETAITQSFAFGGHNAALILGRH